jgi:hypothetical protein
MGDGGGWWDEISFHETRDTGFLLGRLAQLWAGIPPNKPLSVGVTLLDLVPVQHHQPDLFGENERDDRLSPLIDGINRRFGRSTIGFGQVPAKVRTFSGCRRVGSSEKWAVEGGGFRALLTL